MNITSTNKLIAQANITGRALPNHYPVTTLSLRCSAITLFYHKLSNSHKLVNRLSFWKGTMELLYYLSSSTRDWTHRWCAAPWQLPPTMLSLDLLISFSKISFLRQTSPYFGCLLLLLQCPVMNWRQLKTSNI
jgi:hypothetical protein